jgi:hypothetical protein
VVLRKGTVTEEICAASHAEIPLVFSKEERKYFTYIKKGKMKGKTQCSLR